MRIAVIGGGPAGLYFSILMKKADRRHEIVVVERNAPDATFGWGVVFSEETMGELREADYDSYVDITESFAKWGTIDVRYQGRSIRSRGHVFSAISRKLLLNILQRRAAELGVELRFLEEIGEPSAFADCDLVAGADGVNSTVRRLYAEAFKPDLEPYRSRFVWFGTDLVFDAFTFIFRDTEHGMFQVHGYPFDASLSTFIVECNEATWQRAGLGGSSEEDTMAFCRELYADELGGHALLSNRSIWTTFVRVSNETWHHGNVVLLGDAAHTAHFTIGSGTKLAMEDAIALADALARRSELETALSEYELERQPVVERFQEAARQSAAYFENVKRHTDLDLIQFAFNLLTRSGRISHTNLALRDPAFVRALESWFARTAAGEPVAEQRIAPPPMFVPLRLGETTLANRIVVSPRGEERAVDGLPTDGDRERLVEAARSGAGLVLTEPVAVSPDGRVTPASPGIYRDEHGEAWRLIVAAGHASAAALIGLQLGHAGRRAATRPRREAVDLPLAERGWPLLSASPIPYTPLSQVPKKADAADMARVRGDFVAAALRAAEAGFDALELNFAHGYLLASFISPLANRRADAYGPSLENRLRFPLEVLDAVREVWPAERLLAVRFSATDWSPGGLTEEEAVEVALALKAHGCQLIEPVAGQTTAAGRPEYRRSFLVPLADLIRSEARVPTLAGGYVTTAGEANTIIGAGRADLCLLELPR